MTQRIAQAAGGLASAPGTWVGGVVPVDGDTIKIPAGTTVTWDILTRILGSKAAATQHAISILATSSSNFGVLIVNAGCTLTLRGFDQDYTLTGKTCSYVEQWAKFSPQPGSTILLDVATDGQSHFYNHGLIDAIGTAVSRILWDIPAANKNWNTAHSYACGSEVGNVFSLYDYVRNLCAAKFNAACISNAAGTGIGSFGDSSVAFSAITPAGILTTPVSSIALVNGPGKYYVDHEGGHVFFYDTQAVGSVCAFTVTCKKLSRIGASIQSIDATDGNQAIFRYNDVTGLGTHTDRHAIEVAGKTHASGTLRGVEITNCRFKYGCGPKLKDSVIGTLASPIKLDDNEYRGIIPNDYGGAIALVIGTTDYLSIQRSKSYLGHAMFINNYYATPHSNATIEDNVSWAAQFLVNADGSPLWPDLKCRFNAMLGVGAFGDTRQVTMLQGTPGHPAVVQSNLTWRAMRWLNYQSYLDILDNVIGHNYHHTINGPFSGIEDFYTIAVNIKRNLSLHARGGSAFADLGYNINTHTDGATIEKNTIYDNDGVLGAQSFGDEFDNTGAQLLSNLSQQSNLIVACAKAILRRADTVSMRSRVHLTAQDFNNIFGSTVADFTGFNRFCTPSGLANVLGVSLFDPSFAAPVSGKTLALVVTSATNKTLAWDGGVAQQLVQDTGTVTSVQANHAYPPESYINDSSKAWPTDLSNAACPAGTWMHVTSGVNNGLMRRVTSNTANKLTAVPAFPAPMGIGDTYVLVRSEVTLPNAGATATIKAGVYLPNLPTISKSDAGVAIAFNGKTVDPQFVDATRSVETWDASLGGPGTEDSAYARLFADPTLTRTALVPYLKAGFAPQNAALSTAAHDGGVVGAVAFAGQPATQMAFAVPPNGARTATPFVTLPVLHLRDAAGKLTVSSTDVVTVTVKTGAGVLIGVTSKAAVAGVVDFAGSGLGIAGTGDHVLTFAAPGLASLDSPTITVQPAALGAGAPDPTLLPLVSAVSPRYDVYETLGVRALAAGGSYIDPATALKIIKATDAVTPVAMPGGYSHGYASFGIQISQPITFGGHTYRTVYHMGLPGAGGFLFDLDEATDVISNRRAAPSDWVSDLHHSFSNDPATPHIVFYGVGGAPKVKRFDLRTDTEAPNAAFPLGGKDFSSVAPTPTSEFAHFTSSYDDRYFGGRLTGDGSASDTTGPAAIWYDSQTNTIRVFTSARITPFDDTSIVPYGTTKPIHSASMDRAGGKVLAVTMQQMTTANDPPANAIMIFWNAEKDTWSRIVETSSHHDWVGSSGAVFSQDVNTTGPQFYSTLNSMSGSGQIADPHTRVNPAGLSDVNFGSADIHYSGQWQQPGATLGQTYVMLEKFDHEYVAYATKTVGGLPYLDWQLDLGPVYKIGVNYTYPGTMPATARGGVREIYQYDSPAKTKVQYQLVQVFSKAALTEGTFFMDNTSPSAGTLYCWPKNSVVASDQATVLLQPVVPTYGEMSICLVRMDGTDKRMVAAAFSNVAGPAYWDQPRATLSADGKVMMFTSAMNAVGGRTDVFLARLPRAASGAPPLPDHLSMVTQPSSPIGTGASHATQPVVAVRDITNATVITDTSLVTASLVVETGVATPLGTLTKSAVAGVADFASNGLGAVSVLGATAHWHFTDGALIAVDSATFTIVAAAPPPPAFSYVTSPTRLSRPRHTVRQGDTEPLRRTKLLGADGSVQALPAGSVVKYTLVGPEGDIIRRKGFCTIDAATNEVTYHYVPTDTAEPGLCSEEFELTGPDNEILTFPNRGNGTLLITPQLA